MADSLIQDLSALSLPVQGTDLLPFGRGTDPLAKATVADLVLAQSQVTNLATDLGNKQPIDSDLTAIAGLTPSNDDVLQRKAGAWTNRTPAQLKTDLALSSSDVGLGNVTNNAQTQAAIVPNTAPTAGQVLVGNAGGTAYAPVSVSGDATLASTGALTLQNTAVSAGSYTLASITVDSKGRITSASNGSSTWVSGILFRIPSSSEIINNSAAETSCFPGVTPTVPGGTLGTSGILRFEVAGRYVNNTAGTATLTLKILFGGVTYYQDVTTGLTQSANTRSFRIFGDITADNSTSAQRLNAIFSISGLAAVTTGFGDISSVSNSFTMPIGGTPSENSTADKTFDVTLTSSVASTSLTVRVDTAYVSRV